MGNNYTLPTMEEFQWILPRIPEHMVPNNIPTVAISEGFLSDQQCDQIIRMYEGVPAYRFDGCNAQTRECPHTSVLEIVKDVALAANDLFWKFDLKTQDPVSWLQTYEEGESYHMHTDGSPGQMRKLTAVAMLTDEDHYYGGQLSVLMHDTKEMAVPKTRGTIVMFPPWVYHQVSPITWGKRQTINMGFWGPAFR